MIVLSTMEAEYIANAIHEDVMLKSMLISFEVVPDEIDSIKLHSNSIPTIDYFRDSNFHRTIKHIEIKYYFYKE